MQFLCFTTKYWEDIFQFFLYPSGGPAYVLLWFNKCYGATGGERVNVWEDWMIWEDQVVLDLFYFVDLLEAELLLNNNCCFLSKY